MSMIKKAVCALCFVVLAASQVSAHDDLGDHERKPGYSLAAALSNVLYVPIRLAFTVVGAELGALTGFLTAGNIEAAGDVASVFDGTQFLQPEHVEGTEQQHYDTPLFP